MNRANVKDLKEIPNIGPATIKYLKIIGINTPLELIGQNPYSMYKKLCDVTGKQFDPCLADVFIASVKYMEGYPAKRWWQYTDERKKNLQTYY